jgi:hypothetical protein
VERARTHLINFGKYRLIVDKVTELMNFQNIAYNFRVHDRIRSFIFEDIENSYRTAQNGRQGSDKDAMYNWLYDRSEQIEPKDKEATQYPRVRNYSLKAPDRNNSKAMNGNKTYSHSSISSLASKSSASKPSKGDKFKQGKQLQPGVINCTNTGNLRL